LAIVVLVLWFATAIAGLTLLRAGAAARQAAAQQAAPADSLAGALARTGAVPLTAAGKPPPGPHVRVDTPAGEHPLLEFSHPALGVTGIACWMMFTFVHYRPLAWIAFAILVVTLLVGLGWLSRTRRAGARQESQAWAFPSRLIWVHGLLATGSVVLTVLTAVIASRG
jgi:Flp pilus assembly protein TadB